MLNMHLRGWGRQAPPPSACALDWSHPLAQGLTGCWLFHPQVKIADLTRRGSDGTPANGPVWASGLYGPALSLDGSDDYVNIAAHAVYNLTSAYTLEMLFTPDTIPGAGVQRHLLSRWGSGGAGNAAWFLQMYGPNLRMGNHNGTTTATLTGSAGLTAGRACHAVAVWTGGTSGTNGFLYLDGAQDASGTLNAAAQSSNYDVQIGTTNSLTLFTHARVFLARLWNRALSAGEVLRLYNEPFALLYPSPPGRRALTHSGELLSGDASLQGASLLTAAGTRVRIGAASMQGASLLTANAALSLLMASVSAYGETAAESGSGEDTAESGYGDHVRQSGGKA
jgi:hypothetical protein